MHLRTQRMHAWRERAWSDLVLVAPASGVGGKVVTALDVIDVIDVDRRTGA